MDDVVAELSCLLRDADDTSHVGERDRMELRRLHTSIGKILDQQLAKSSEDYALKSLS